MVDICELLITLETGERVVLSEKPDSKVVPKYSWFYKDAPRVSSKDTTNGLVLPPCPNFVPDDFIRPDIRRSGMKPPRTPQKSSISPKKKRLVGRSMSRRMKKEKKKEEEDNESDLWSSKSITLTPWTTPSDIAFSSKMVKHSEDWYIESGFPDAPFAFDGSELIIMFKSEDVPYYGHQLYELEHHNFVGESDDGISAVASIEIKTKNRQQEKLKCVVRTTDDLIAKRIWLPADVPFRKSIKIALPELSNVRWTKVRNQDIKKELVSMEERYIFDKFKFGVFYAKDNPTENELFNTLHENTSQDYKDFLECIGMKIEQQGWNGYRGGLDVKTNTTGTHSLYAKLKKYEIIYRVVTMLPSQKDDTQQVERKKFLGNDILVIVFHEGKVPFDLNSITSQITRIIVIVEKVKDAPKLSYSMVVASRQGVASHIPNLPSPPIFEANTHFRQYFLTKCINAERTVLRSTDFGSKLTMSSAHLLRQMVETYKKTNSK